MTGWRALDALIELIEKYQVRAFLIVLLVYAIVS